MGLETLLTLAVSAASAVSSSVQARKRARAERTANAIQGAGGEIENRLARRRAAREERLKRARLVNSGELAGASGSSGMAGASSALQSNFGAGVAGQRSQELASRGISAALQRSADAQSRMASLDQWSQIGQKVIGIAGDEGWLDPR